MNRIRDLGMKMRFFVVRFKICIRGVGVEVVVGVFCVFKVLVPSVC